MYLCYSKLRGKPWTQRSVKPCCTIHCSRLHIEILWNTSISGINLKFIFYFAMGETAFISLITHSTVERLAYNQTEVVIKVSIMAEIVPFSCMFQSRCLNPKHSGPSQRNFLAGAVNNPWNRILFAPPAKSSGKRDYDKRLHLTQ